MLNKIPPKPVRYSPLPQQFADPEPILNDIRALVASGDFTLGKVVGEFEAMFAEMLGVRYAIGVGSGTDALKVPLKAAGLGPGDEVITTANTFWATVGAIAEVGATPKFIDCDDSFGMDIDQLEAAIGPRTKAIVPVQLTGDVIDMPRVMAIAAKQGLPVIEDACQSLFGEWDGRKAGSFGVAGAFSMHPLKIINVWGDAGIIVTNDDEMNRRCRLLRNHGLRGRDTMEIYGYNTRLDSLQAVPLAMPTLRLDDAGHGLEAAADSVRRLILLQGKAAEDDYGAANRLFMKLGIFDLLLICGGLGLAALLLFWDFVRLRRKPAAR